MISLREEIYELMERALYRSIDSSSRKSWTDDILKLFEKRIDEYIIEKHIPKKYSRTPQSEYDMAAEQALEDFKPEILK